MLLTIREVTEKINNIDRVINMLDTITVNNSQKYDLFDAVELLREYRTKILDTTVNV